ncbi:MAG: SDR family oxidoreductase [Thiomonas arsenitoxydans]|uniref:dTDP-4-dehydrorhamnose reductase n=1 Tax=Thiomonas arsenitoxydans (strain DSM 22701 / CIP 110005 / 3As) TaxID=426114 RepID=A0A8I1MTL8_THIA3|nr:MULTISPECIES: SDR family oxidoreductase [Thiomonas]MBN8742707.1 SDR family oxidoreductase [Thiomonas arsenitoxydans]ODU98137.1 MAG: NAD(P)-dependent oxidoreductase [Thiomonas sp. SCN 64-16]
MRVLVLGASGMLGNAVFRIFGGDSAFEVFGSARSNYMLRHFDGRLAQRTLIGFDVENSDALMRLFAIAKPDLVINCIGLVKQLSTANQILEAVPLNAILPHRLAVLCEAVGARLIQVSTDCVFSGAKGDYLESDFADAHDIYGRSKFLGEVDYPNAITLRTSIIGHELEGNRSLIGWFLSQQGTVKGFTKAVFSGLPTVELATVMKEYVVPRPQMRGLYHVSAAPIDKYALLQLVADAYGKEIRIDPSDELVIDRSLNSTRFRLETGYQPPEWPELVRRMQDFK